MSRNCCFNTTGIPELNPIPLFQRRTPVLILKKQKVCGIFTFCHQVKIHMYQNLPDIHLNFYGQAFF
jgi:hypothetical protein